MANYQFIPKVECLSEEVGCYPIAALAEETGVYSATPEFVREHCGPIAVGILNRVPDWYYAEAKQLGLHVNCDIRIHRLYPSDYPAYPGWHCDGEFRETYFAQPDMERIQVHKHLTCTVSSHPQGVSNAQFLMEPFRFVSDETSADFVLWREINAALEAQPIKRVLDTRDGQLWCFDSWTLHRVMPATIRGWRLFFRMSMWHRPNLGDGGRVTRQEQVYKYVGQSGW